MSGDERDNVESKRRGVIRHEIHHGGLFMKTSACIDALYGEIPFLDRFHAAKDVGFDAVEFWGWPEKDLNAVKEPAEKAGIPICGFKAMLIFP
jgi:sugar phosphate isomerase/epimerase